MPRYGQTRRQKRLMEMLVRRQNNTRGMGLARDVKAGQAEAVNRGRLPRRRRYR